MRFGPPPALYSGLLLTGAGLSNGGSGALLPPSVAPVLDVQTTLGSNDASLTWTASNRTGSAGFGYLVEVDIDGGGYSTLTTTTNRYYTDTQGSAAGETYTYRVTPFNDYGEGPASNEVGVVLPGESEAPTVSGLELNAGGNILLNAGGAILIN